MIFSRATRERLDALDRRAQDLERRITHARCCPSTHRVGALVHEWRLLRDTMMQIKRARPSQKFPRRNYRRCTPISSALVAVKRE